MKILFLGNSQQELTQLQEFINPLGGTVTSANLNINNKLYLAELLNDLVLPMSSSMVEKDLFIIGDKDIDDTVKGYIIGSLVQSAPVALVSNVFNKYPFLARHALVDDILGKNISSLPQYQRVLNEFPRGSEEFVSEVIKIFRPFRSNK
jgi:hypothetical protein